MKRISLSQIIPKCQICEKRQKKIRRFFGDSGGSAAIVSHFNIVPFKNYSHSKFQCCNLFLVELLLLLDLVLKSVTTVIYFRR